MKFPIFFHFFLLPTSGLRTIWKPRVSIELLKCIFRTRYSPFTLASQPPWKKKVKCIIKGFTSFYLFIFSFNPIKSTDAVLLFPHLTKWGKRVESSNIGSRCLIQSLPKYIPLPSILLDLLCFDLRRCVKIWKKIG